MKQLGLFFILFTLSACTASYDIVRHGDKQLSMTDSYYISTPQDGWYDTQKYNNSGRMTRDALYSELSLLGVETVKGTRFRDKKQSLVAAKQQQCKILLYPSILHWEDRATEWSGIRDKARIQLEMINTETGVTLDNTTLDLVGTWWTLGGHHPQDMVNESVKDYFQQLFVLDGE